MKPPVLTLALVGAITLVISVAQARTWTQAATGRTIEGEFVSLKDAETASIRLENGTVVDLKLDVLSQEDRDFISTQAAATPGADMKKDEAAGGEPGAGLPTEIPEGETTVVVSNVHLCCGGCEKGVEKALEDFEDYKIDFQRSEGKFTLTGKTGNDVYRMLNSISKSGYYGTTDHGALILDGGTASDKEVEKLSVSGVHLCCKSCVKAIDKAMEGVEGFEAHTAESKKGTFEVTGKIKPSAVLAALHAEGINGKIKVE